MGLDMYLGGMIRKGRTREWEEIAYWRRAYGILRWFGQNLQSVKSYKPEEGNAMEGVENGKEYEVTKEEYHKLLEDCKKILRYRYELEKLPKRLYPLRDLFFEDEDFGQADIDALDRTFELLAIGEKMIDWDEDEVIFQISY